MKSAVFYKILLFAVFVACIIYISCNTIDREEPIFNERNNSVNGKDREAIVNSYTQGIHTVSFIDSAKLYIDNAGIKKMLFGLSDFYSDLNGHLKSLATAKKISLAQAAEIENGNDVTTGKNTNKGFVDEAIVMLKKEIILFNNNADESSDADTKNYFALALPSLIKQLDILTDLSANLND